MCPQQYEPIEVSHADQSRKACPDLRINRVYRTLFQYLTISSIAAQNMPRAPRRRGHKSNGSATDTMPLLEPADKKCSLQQNKQQPVSGKKSNQPLYDQAQTTLPLRLLHDYVGPEAWWTPFKASTSQQKGSERKEHRDKPTTGEGRLNWMRRLRPKPHRQCALGRAG